MEAALGCKPCKRGVGVWDPGREGACKQKQQPLGVAGVGPTRHLALRLNAAAAAAATALRPLPCLRLQNNGLRQLSSRQACHRHPASELSEWRQRYRSHQRALGVRGCGGSC